MTKDRIQDNDSYKKTHDDIIAMESFGDIIKGLSYLGIKNDQLDEVFLELPKIKENFISLSEGHDEFNNYFSNNGWIAHESMSNALMHKSIDLAKEWKIKIAEELLVKYYSSEDMKWLINRFKAIDEFSIRYDFFVFAYNDTISERYYSAVPILLMMIDGIVNDINENKWFFTNNTDLTAWDSIAGHSSWLSLLSKIFSDDRKKTRTSKITLPYRNWILHWRDLGYANVDVTAKCWAALFAIRDWVEVIKEWKRGAPLKEENKPIIKGLLEWFESLKETQIIKDKINSWVPRKAGFFKEEWFEFLDSTPEKEVLNFIEYWTKSNYGNLANQVCHIWNAKINEKKEAWRIREIFEGKELIEYEIISIKDCAPAVSEITLIVVLKYKDQEYTKTITLRFIYTSSTWEPLIFGDPNGKWKFIKGGLSDIDFIC